ncbi:MAG: ABC transporter substrate-binding protein [bacterium]|nr:ABC transporter substrate-binding protein [bacterium]
MKKVLLFLLLTLIAGFIGSCKQDVPNEIRIGGIFDMSGPTSDVGEEYGYGAIDYLRYVNEQGGINGRKINLIWKDYKYKISEAYVWYSNLKAQKVLAIIGWGTGDTEALAPKVAADKIPFISASYSEKIADGKEHPYNFIGSVSYSDQTRIALKYIKNVKNDAKVAFIYNDTGFGRSPFFPDGLEFAKVNKINVSEKIVIPLSGKGALEKLKNMKVDWAIVQQSGTASVAIIKAVKKLGLNTRLILLNWALDENVVKKLGNDTSEVYGTIGYGVWNDTKLAGVKLMHDINQKYNPEKKERSCRYIQGYINAKILVEAIKRAGDDLNSRQIKKELESLNEFDTGGSFNRVTFTKLIHKPAASLKMYSIKQGKLVPITPLLITVEQKIWTEY